MEDFRLDIIIGSGPAAQTVKIDLPRFTLIGATTRAGMISSPLRDRFGMHFRLQFYSQEELAKIIQRASVKLGKICYEDASMEMARRCRGTPRISLRLLKRVRDYAEVENEDHISLERAKYGLDELGVNNLGFNELELNERSTILDNHRNTLHSGIQTIGRNLDLLGEGHRNNLAVVGIRSLHKLRGDFDVLG
jgi:Holliday junction DNA helicase RuvB